MQRVRPLQAARIWLVPSPQQLRELSGHRRLGAVAVHGYARAGYGHAAGHLDGLSETTVERSDPLAMEVIFTTPVGFRDQVDFRIDPQAQRVDFRSRSLFGLFDWGKNRSRMQEFTPRFEQQSRL
jgi:hypothetical protein